MEIFNSPALSIAIKKAVAETTYTLKGTQVQKEKTVKKLIKLRKNEH